MTHDDQSHGSGSETSDLGPLRAELEVLQHRLAEIEESSRRRHLSLIRGLQRNVVQRKTVFESELFGDPGWDILICLYAADLERRQVSVSSLCEASGVALTTGLRWLDRLEGEGWVSRTPDPGHRRRIFVQLTPRAGAAMHSYFDDLLERTPTQRC